MLIWSRPNGNHDCSSWLVKFDQGLEMFGCFVKPFGEGMGDFNTMILGS